MKKRKLILNFSWAIGTLLCLFAMPLMIYCLMTLAVAEPFNGQAWFIFVLILIFWVAYAMFMDNIKNRRAYYEWITVPMSDFEVNLYDNRIVIVHENHAWTFVHGREKIAKFENIHAIQYYTFRKKFVGWDLAPYKV